MIFLSYFHIPNEPNKLIIQMTIMLRHMIRRRVGHWDIWNSSIVHCNTKMCPFFETVLSCIIYIFQVAPFQCNDLVFNHSSCSRQRGFTISLSLSKFFLEKYRMEQRLRNGFFLSTRRLWKCIKKLSLSPPLFSIFWKWKYIIIFYHSHLRKLDNIHF